MTHLTLNSGASLPSLGMGTYKLDGAACARAVAEALELGYTHFDTAAMYGNETAVGRGLAEAKAPREKLFVTTKVWRDSLRRGAALKSCEASLKNLKLEYLDLLLIHWPNADVPLGETLGAFAELLDAGKIRHAGVSNFTVSRLKEALALNACPIACNQIEYHIHLNQEPLRAFCAERGVALVAYSPLGKGRWRDDELAARIGAAHGKSAAQVALRWLVQKGIGAIPKAGRREHLAANLDVFDWSLTDEELRRLDTEPRRERLIDWDVAAFEE
ncbi:MAG: aldo/keto reductase [Planctomycetota bacterium]|nr:aldo/keto reductase [Planctomycetota bacterium]